MNITEDNNITNQSIEKKNKSIMDLSILGRKILTMKFEKKPTDHEFTINDLNNYVGADRKLIVNDSNEFWVHDVALIKNSNFFKQNFSGERKNLKEDIENKSGVNLNKTYVYVPHPEYFFDILTWIYSRDAKRLSLAADEPESFLCILNLGIFLEMNDDFFKTLLEHCEIKLDEELLNYNLWSRFSFTFEVLINLLNLMPKDNYFLKVNALLSWLKEDNTQKTAEPNETIREKEFELLTSKDYFLVKNFLVENKFLHFINVNQLLILKNKFPYLIPALDTSYLIEKYIVKPTMRIFCRVCKKVANNIQDFSKSDCEVKMYHPRNIINLQRQLNSSCEHENCTRKLVINEYPCCHKGAHIEGCMQNDGKHIIQIDLIGAKSDKTEKNEKENNNK